MPGKRFSSIGSRSRSLTRSATASWDICTSSRRPGGAPVRGPAGWLGNLKVGPVGSDAVKMSPAAVLDRVTGGRGALAIKYSMVSVVGVTLTQLMLVVLVGILDLNPTWSHVAAVSITAIPVFFLNKRWVWLHDGKASIKLGRA